MSSVQYFPVSPLILFVCAFMSQDATFNRTRYAGVNNSRGVLEFLNWTYTAHARAVSVQPQGPLQEAPSSRGPLSPHGPLPCWQYFDPLAGPAKGHCFPGSSDSIKRNPYAKRQWAAFACPYPDPTKASFVIGDEAMRWFLDHPQTTR